MAKFSVNVRSNAKTIAADLRKIAAEHDARARSRALNRTADRAVTFTSRELRKRYKLKHRDVLDAIGINYANADRLQVVLTVRGRPLSIARFVAAAKAKSGVTVNVKGTRKLVKGAFLRTLKTKKGDDYAIVFKREGASRYPLKAVKTVDVPGIFSIAEVQKLLDAFAIEQFENEYSRLLERELAR